MLKNLHPVITGDLLRVLDSIQPGQSLAIVDDDAPYRHLDIPAVHISPVTVEEAVEAIFSALPLAHDGHPPLLSWFADSTDDRSLDIAYAIKGLASDAELRRIEMTTTTDQRDFTKAMKDTVATITVPTTTPPWALIIRAGCC